MGRNRDMSKPGSPLDELMADVEFFRNQQNFEPKDSLLGSALAHPIEAIDRYTDNIRILQDQGAKYQPNKSVWTSKDKAQAALNLVGMVQSGGATVAPKAFGTLGTVRSVHGSASPKYKKVSDKYLTTGEGVQAHGGGHYSGTNTGAIDDWYRARLAKNYDKILDSYLSSPRSKKDYNDWLKLNRSNLKAQADRYGENLDEYAEEAFYNVANERFAAIAEGNANPQFAKGSIGDFSQIDDYFIDSYKQNPGYTYMMEHDVNWGDLLHRNKPMNRNPKKVQERLAPYIKGYKKDHPLYEPTGKDVSDWIFNNVANKDIDKTKRVLMDAGIPGTTHLGQAGDGLPNLVMHNPEDTKIIRRIRGGLDNTSKEKTKALLDWPTKPFPKGYSHSNKYK